MEYEEKEVQTKTFEQNENNEIILESYRYMEQNIDQKLNENINKIREDIQTQFKLTEGKNENLRNSIKDLEISQIQIIRKKEEEKLAKQEKNEIAFKTLQDNLKQNNEIFNSFQSLMLNLHQNEVKKLEEISSTIETLKLKEVKDDTESFNDDQIDKDLQNKMLNHLELLDKKYKNSPTKEKKSQRSPLKILSGSADWAIGELESDKDSEENLIYASDLFSNTLRFICRLNSKYLMNFF